MKSVIIILGLAAVAMAQQKYYNQQGQSQYAQPTTTPVPILKQINRHNDDGSYSFGYEAADGSFKIETKHQNGEVYGKYGYVDNEGTVREVEYGASKQRGFEPTGTGINVPPVTTDEQNYSAIRPLAPGEEDDGQYREDPSIYWKDARYNSPAAAAPVQKQAPRPQYYQPQQQQQVAPQYDEQDYEQPQQTYQAPQHRFQYAQQRQQQQQPRSYYQPQPVQQQQHYQAQPQPGYDINTGSYTINYSG